MQEDYLSTIFEYWCNIAERYQEKTLSKQTKTINFFVIKSNSK